jgi:peptide-methionine (R)-S-oxide reductase
MIDSAPPRPPVTRRQVLLGGSLLSVGLLAGCRALHRPLARSSPNKSNGTFPVTHTDAEWRQRLSPQQYEILRNAGTEQPYSSRLNDEHRSGVFSCAGCEQDLFSSATKFDSGTGWPSFYQSLGNAVITREDDSLGMTRTEVLCSRCGGHLGHVFDDGPAPTGLRYCMNGVAMNFRPQSA